MFTSFLKLSTPAPILIYPFLFTKFTIQKPEYIGSIIEEESIGKKHRKMSINEKKVLDPYQKLPSSLSITLVTSNPILIHEILHRSKDWPEQVWYKHLK